MLDGVDRFFRAGGAPARNNGRDFVTLRFHVHPDIELYHDEEDRLVLTAPQCRQLDHVLRRGARRRSRRSIFFAGLGGPRRSRQIVLSFKASDIPEVHWQLTRTRTRGCRRRAPDRATAMLPV